MTMSGAEMSTVVFAGIAALAASAQTYLSFEARDDFRQDMRSSNVSEACASVVAAVSDFGTTLGNIYVNAPMDGAEFGAPHPYSDSSIARIDAALAEVRKADFLLETHLGSENSAQFGNSAETAFQTWMDVSFKAKKTISYEELNILSKNILDLIPTGIAECRELMERNL